MARIDGTSASEVLEGTEEDDVILGNGGDDTIRGNGGNDRLAGRDGNVTLEGGDGDDALFLTDASGSVDGGAGFDTLTVILSFFSNVPDPSDTVIVDPDSGILSVGGIAGSLANVEQYTLATGTGDDVLITGDFDDVINAYTGNNWIEARGGNDQITVGSGENFVDAGAGNDTIRSFGTGDDILIGGDGDDVIEDNALSFNPDSGNDFIDGGAGNDEITVRGGFSTIIAGIGDDTVDVLGFGDLDGGDGYDTLILDAFVPGDRFIPGALELDASTGEMTLNGLVGSATNFEAFRIETRGAFDDRIAVGSANDAVNSGNGNDTVFGRGGDDSIISGMDGSDFIDAGDGNDNVQYDWQPQFTSGGKIEGDVNSVLIGGEGIDRLTTRFSDSFTENIMFDASAGTMSWNGGLIQFSGFETLLFISGSGDDIIIGGDDYLLTSGGAGDDQFFAGNGGGIFFGADGNDTVTLTGDFSDFNLIQFSASNLAIFENADGIQFDLRVETAFFADGVFDLANGVFTPNEVSNTAPDALDDAASADEDASTSGNVLANDSDADGDAIEVITVNGLPVGTPIIGLYGTLMLAADGSFTYTADQPGADRLADGTSADDVFTYEVSDGDVSSTASLTVTVTAVADGRFVVGSDGDDVLPGGDLDDVIDGLGGDDRLLGGGGDDLLDGGTGDDRLNGGEDDDTLFGGDGNDILFGNDGDDVLVGGNGDDLMVGHAGADVFVVGGDAGSHDIIRDFETGVDSLELADDASIIAILEASSGTTLSLSDGSSVTLNGINDVDLAEILEPLAAEQQVEALLSNFTDGLAQDATVFQAPVKAGSILDQAIEPDVTGFAGPMTDAMEDHAIPEPLIA